MTCEICREPTPEADLQSCCGCRKLCCCDCIDWCAPEWDPPNGDYFCKECQADEDADDEPEPGTIHNFWDELP